MSWVYLDDGFPDHPKVVAAGDDAAWLYVCGLAYCRRFNTEGQIPAAQVRKLTNHRKPDGLAGKLVDVGLWEHSAEGFVVHDYRDWNKDRDARSAAGKKAARARWHKNDASESHANRNANASETHVPQDAHTLLPSPSSNYLPRELPVRENDAAGVADASTVVWRAAGMLAAEAFQQAATIEPIRSPKAWKAEATRVRANDPALIALAQTNPEWNAERLASEFSAGVRPSPEDNTARAAKVTMARNAARAAGLACEECDGTGMADTGTGYASCQACKGKGVA